MRYRIEISTQARGQLRDLPKELRRNIRARMEMMCEYLHGDVLKLREKDNRYKLRIGSHRILFVLAGKTIQVYAVTDRRSKGGL